MKLALKRADICDLVRSDEVLRATGLMKALGSDADAVLKAAIARRYPDRAVLFQQGDAGNALFFVLKGEVRLSARKGSDMVELGIAGRGEVFGETEVQSGKAVRTTSVVAQGDVDTAEIPRAALLQGGRVPDALAAFLKPITVGRLKALTEMTDFMNRW